MRWPEAGIAGEPVLPIPAVMRTHGTGWTRRGLGLLRRLNQGKDLHILLAPVGHPAAAKCSPGHIHPANWPQLDRLARNHGRWGQETTHRTLATGPIPL